MTHTAPQSQPIPLWRAIVILMLSIGVVGSNSLLLSPLVLAVGTDLGVNPEHVMRAASTYGLGVAASALTLAPMADRFGAGRVLTLALVALSAGLALSAMTSSLTLLMAAQALCGIAGGAALPSIYTLAAVIAPKGREARTVGAVLTGWTVSMVLGVSLSAWIADLFGWRHVYVGLSAAAACLWFAALGMRHLKSGSVAVASSPFTALRVPGMLRGMLATICMMLAFYVTYFFVGAHVTLGLGLSTTQAGLVPLVYGAGFGAAVLLDPVLDRLGSLRATPPVFVVVTAVYLVMIGVADHYIGLLVLSALWGMFQHLGLNLLVARLTALNPGQRGAIMGLYSTTTYLCVFAAPFIGAPLFARWGFAGCLMLAALLCLIEVFEAQQRMRRTGLPEPV